MNRWQKIAWFNIVSLTLIILISNAVVFWAAMYWIGFPNALGFYGILGFGIIHALGYIIFPLRKRPGQVLSDERDTYISQRAMCHGNLASNVVLLLSFFGAWLVLGLTGSIQVASLGVAGAGWYITSRLVESISTLILYGRTINE